jgi:3-oxoisoapionate decarboxylase
MMDNRLTGLVNRLTTRGTACQAGPVTIGLGTYAFFWQWHSSAEQPLTLADMVDRTAEQGATRFQICDYPAVEEYDAAGLAALRDRAGKRGVTLELGTRGLRPDHLRRYLDLAAALDASLVRSMVTSGEDRPGPDEAVDRLTEVLPDFERAGVTLALETYEQVPGRTLVDIVEEVGSPQLGICLDPANSVAALEHPLDTIALAAPHVRNVHVKDFCFTRQDGWVGFNLVGCPLGEGLLDYHQLVEAVRPQDRGVSQIVEHWLPWQGDTATSIRTEQQWTEHNLSYLRSMHR